MKTLWLASASSVLIAGSLFLPVQAQPFGQSPGDVKQQTREIVFRTQVKPIFDKSCISCHGAARQRGGLRLDTVDGIKKGGESGMLFVAGKAKDSRLIHSINGTNGMTKMPMVGDELKPAQKKILEDWINQGAKF